MTSIETEIAICIETHIYQIYGIWFGQPIGDIHYGKYDKVKLLLIIVRFSFSLIIHYFEYLIGYMRNVSSRTKVQKE